MARETRPWTNPQANTSAIALPGGDTTLSSDLGEEMETKPSLDNITLQVGLDDHLLEEEEDRNMDTANSKGKGRA